ncbi:uncharacterized protein LOC124262038 [Haliotis rubra]|uniref:uncharacterized protein LOC124262038 n=1 Tax=Haliotis rubra TaxID=36100 RepID=UPI001EE5B068|nr:uncharacterized protein LOC124262038 [Haliotis rubra]XP_046552417.1 uncharacterized protein LOC124262038 [Haliotis rubra]
MAHYPGPTQIVFSFDTTGSMSAILDEVRGRLQDMIQRLQADIPGISISVVAHGDYCDKDMFYVTSHLDFTDNVMELCNFVNESEGTGGGDVEECYELVLRLVSGLAWKGDSQKVLIMIGDAYPHEPDYPLNTMNLDWRVELQDLVNMGVRVYGVQVGGDETSQTFFQALSDKGGGQYLKLENFSNICTFIMAICYRERGEDFLQDYEAEIRAAKGKKSMNKDLEGLFGTLRRDDSKASSVGGPGALIGPLPDPISPLSLYTQPSFDTLAPTAVVAKYKTKKVRKTVKKSKPRKRIKTEKKRLRREKVPHTNFAYNDYRWSPWQLAIVPSRDQTTGGTWKDFRHGLGLKKCCLNLFKKSGNKHTFVEVSVQPRPHAKRQVVMFKVLNGNLSPENWFRLLFGRRKIQEELERVLNSGCRLFVRKAQLKRSGHTVKQEEKDISSLYDYAWQTSDKCHRGVYIKKYDFYISGDGQ